ncbi:hypothetical protein Tco_0755989 [Tanacetum coccineum]
MTLEETETDEEEHQLNKRQTGIVIGRGVHIKIDEETLDQSTMKLKGVETMSSTAQFLLDMKKVKKASKDDYTIQQHPKGPGEGSIIVPYIPDEPSDSSSSSHSSSNDEEGFMPTDDEATKEKFDDNARTETYGSKKTEDDKDADEKAGEEQATND